VKWPRQYAEEIAKEPSREKRKAMLEQVPEEFREWVKKLVVMGWDS